MFSDEAQTAIRNPYCIDADQVILHLWVLPMMRGTANGWTVFRAHGYKNYDEMQVYKVQRVRMDWRRWRKPLNEALVTQTATLDTPQLQNQITQARQIHIPLLGVTVTRGKDGTYYGIKAGDEYGGFSLTWWSVEPEEWQSIDKWFHTFTNYLDKQFTQKRPVPPKQE
jgi:hypothetical protein